MAKNTSVKNSGKLRNLLSKLNPNSPKKKLLLFIIVFGLLGGGYYAYRSFADTNMIIVNASQMSGGTPIYATVNNKRVMVERLLTSKVETKIAPLSGQGSRQTWRLCINARDIEGKTDYIEGTNSWGSTEVMQAGAPIPPFKIKNGWYDTGSVVGNNGFKIIGFTGKDRKPNKTIAVSQIALVRHMGACP